MHSLYALRTALRTRGFTDSLIDDVVEALIEAKWIPVRVVPPGTTGKDLGLTPQQQALERSRRRGLAKRLMHDLRERLFRKSARE